MKDMKGLLALAITVTVFAAGPSHAFNQPLLNYGLTDVLDGAVPSPGTYFFEYIQVYQSDEFKDRDGNNIPGDPRVGFVLSMNQLVHVSTKTFLGGNLGIDILQPIGQLNGEGTLGPGGPPVTANPGPLGTSSSAPSSSGSPTSCSGAPSCTGSSWT
jgi:hypothetical protein